MPRILYICSSWPLGKSFGGQIRALHIGRALQKAGDVDVLMVGSDAVDREAYEKTSREFYTLPPIAPAATDPQKFRYKLRRAVDTRFLDIHGVACPAADRERIDMLLGNYELVWLLNSRTPNIIGRWRWPRSHLDIDDLPSTYLRSVAQNGPTIFVRLKAGLQHILMRRREQRLHERFSTLSVCSHEDKAQLRGGDRVFVLPNGFERPKVPPLRNLLPSTPRIGFIGLYSYPPNLDGVQWFLKECWAQIRQAIPGIRLRLVGKETDGPLKPQAPDVDAFGWVADPGDEIATWSAMIVPVRFGGGTRIKIAEAFSRKCPAVSTPLGAFGYDVEHGRDIMLAANASTFARACVELVNNPTRGSAIAECAWTKFLNKWTWDAIAPTVQSIVQMDRTN